MTATKDVQEAVTITPYQQRVAMVPEEFDLAVFGGRGAGKSWALALLILRHVEQYGDLARVLFIRRTYAGLRDFEGILRELFGTAYGTRARYNSVERIWRLPNSAHVELGQMENRGDYGKFQGRSFTLLVCDEVSQYPDSSLLDLLRSNLRARRGVAIRTVYAGNPGGVGHGFCSRRFANNGVAPWTPYLDEHSGRYWVTCPGTFRDNPMIAGDEYETQLAAACAGDPDLLKAWVHGDFSACVGGSFFGDCIDESRVAIDPTNWTLDWLEQQRQPAYQEHRTRRSAIEAAARAYADGWPLFLAGDYGSAAPAAFYVCARAPGGVGPDDRAYGRGSVLLLDELYSCQSEHPEKGLGWTVPVLADHIKRLCERWAINPRGPGHLLDDACFARHGHASGSIADELNSAGALFRPAQKGSRIAGWQKMRGMLEAAGDIDRAGLYVSRRCVHWWRTVPYLARDRRHPEDLDTRAEDHAADSCRMALGDPPGGFTSGSTRDLFRRRPSL